MKALKKIAPVFALGLALVGTAHANATDAAASHASTVKTREVTYTCQSKATAKVVYGFNKQGLPTYAQATLGGKQRFMPINLDRSDDTSTFFGDDDSWKLGAGYMTLNNYHKVPVSNIQNPAHEITHKSCSVTKVRKLKG